MSIIEDINNYKPLNEQEEVDKQHILHCLKTQPNIYDRSNETCHMTASAWVINQDHNKVLMAYHKIYNSFAWLGGHADGQQDLKEVALKEVREESGLQDVRFASDDILSLEVLTVDGHEKRGKYVSSHLHLNITYLIIADDHQPLKVKEDENSAVQWFDIDKVIDASKEEWFKQRVYPKLNYKVLNQ